MAYIVTPEWVQMQIRNEEEMVIIDVRFNLSDPKFGYQAYVQNHIPNAYYLHIDYDLSSPPQEHGGNHPLPDIDKLANKLGKMGIDHDTTVIIYDGANEMYAPRAWWQFHYMGHNKVYVMDGGFQAWIRLGYEVTDDIPKRNEKIFEPRILEEAVVHMEEVRDRDQKKSVLIDSRAYSRYVGKTEPLYKKAGHIPGAKNYFWQDVLDEEGNWKTADVLKEQFEKMDNDGVEEIIVSCGSGISACPNILALKMAGFENVKLYPGSFSDWISYVNNPLETTDETSD